MQVDYEKYDLRRDPRIKIYTQASKNLKYKDYSQNHDIELSPLQTCVILGLTAFGLDITLDELGQCLDYLQARGYNEIDTA